ncbi:MAG: hypothetical protein AB1758_06975 [Candidatus Eremiobacterota bacterium]
MELEVREMEDEVVQFVTTEAAYIAYTAQGRRLDILKSVSVQPPIREEASYATYMWVRALQGYFLLRQRIEESKPGPWFVIRELVPEQDYLFFENFQDQVEEFAQGL